MTQFDSDLFSVCSSNVLKSDQIRDKVYSVLLHRGWFSMQVSKDRFVFRTAENEGLFAVFATILEGRLSLDDSRLISRSSHDFM